MRGPLVLRGEVIRDSTDGSLYRVIYICEGGAFCYWIRLAKGNNVPKRQSMEQISEKLLSGEYEAVIDSFTAEGHPDQDISGARLAIRDRNYDLIRDIISREPDIYDIHRRADILRQQEEQTGVRMNNLYKLLGTYWRGGMNRNAMLPDLSKRGRRPEDFVPSVKLGRPGKKGENGKILSAEDRERFARAIQLYYYKDTKPTLHEAYDDMIAHMYVVPRFSGDTDPEQLPPDEKPSFAQFYYWYRKNKDAVAERREREKERYDLKYRGITGSSETFVPGPGMAAQIDATIADFYLVREDHRDELVGRPVMFFVKDVRTRIVMGMHITLENASWNSALMALKNTAEDKQAYCRRYGVEISPDEWPCRHVPLSITADNGEMGDKGVEEVIARLGITIENTPPYRGDLKAIIENTFQSIQGKLRYIVPGHVEKDDGQRGSIDRKKSACMDINAFTAVIIRCILYYNNYHYMESYQKTPELRRSGIRPIPVELWNYGIRHQTGALRVLSQEEIIRALLPRDRASVTEKGILFHDLYYTCSDAEDGLWYDQARIDGRRKLPVIYDPTCVDNIYFIAPDGRLITCCLLAKSAVYSGSTEEDMAQYRNEDREERAAWAQEMEKARTKLILTTEAVVKRCRNEKKEAGTEAAGAVLNRHSIRAQRQAEKEQQSGASDALLMQHKTEQTAPRPAGKYQNAGDAIDDSIDRALRDSGLYD